MVKKVLQELKEHYPFTAAGAILAVLFMLVFKRMPYERAHGFFYIAHPLHVFFSAVVTTALLAKYNEGKLGPARLLWIAVLGYIGSVGIGTISDSIAPYFGELILEMPHSHAHIGFLEEPLKVNFAALVGIAFGLLSPKTKLPHSAHVFISTAASMFHMMMAKGPGGTSYFAIFIFLFAAVWIPCCISDIVFPMFFAKDDAERGVENLNCSKDGKVKKGHCPHCGR